MAEDVEKPLDPEEAGRIIFNIAEGLKYAHSQRIVHLDLKPKNILIKKTSQRYQTGD